MNFFHSVSEKEVTKGIFLDSASKEETKNEFLLLGC